MEMNILYFLLFFLILLIINDKKNNIIIYSDDSSESDDEDYINEPSRYYDSKYISREKMKINYPTRGEPPSYQQVGILTDENDPENVKPLYGRQTYRGSNLWNYFTSLDSHLSTKIPISISDNNCTDERGCSEINKSDTLNVLTKNYNVELYKINTPRYIPNYIP
jgi:hypothetical protein